METSARERGGERHLIEFGGCRRAFLRIADGRYSMEPVLSSELFAARRNGSFRSAGCSASSWRRLTTRSRAAARSI